MIIRTKRQASFTVLGNDLFGVAGLSWQAEALLHYLLSRPDNWSVSVAQLVKIKTGRGTSRDATTAMLRELVKAGYVVRKKQSSGAMHYWVYDRVVTQAEHDDLQQPEQEKPAQGEPKPEKPDQEKPDLGNPALINTDSKQELIEHSAPSASDEASTPAKVAELPVKGGGRFIITEPMMAPWREAYPDVDVMHHLRRMYLWLTSNPNRQKTQGGMPRFITNWLGGQQREATSPQATTQQRTALDNINDTSW